MSIRLDGRATANALLSTLTERVESLKAKGVLPKLVVIMVGENPASQVYVRHKEKACLKIGMLSEKIEMESSVSEEELLKKVEELNKDVSVHGMIVQLPLPDHIDAQKIIKAIDAWKDVDGFHAYNMGKTVISKDFEQLSPCTPKGITKILDAYEIDPNGMDAVVIGRSNIVGKPIAMMLLNRNATVSICHSRTKDLARYTKEADLIVVAVGRPHFLKADMVKDGAVIIDVGINRVDNPGGKRPTKLVGDVDYDAMEDKVSAITPVPGGVGPMTVACLLANTINAAEQQMNYS
jgi:methylenetetrahydrofolate dehydrogenase (NADP+)/methenyltetrahydrofolate cyclohydrolase